MEKMKSAVAGLRVLVVQPWLVELLAGAQRVSDAVPGRPRLLIRAGRRDPICTNSEHRASEMLNTIEPIYMSRVGQE